MELVDPALPAVDHSYSGAGQFFGEAGLRREGWGSVEATEMVLNNLFYITAKVSHCTYISISTYNIFIHIIYITAKVRHCTYISISTYNIQRTACYCL